MQNKKLLTIIIACVVAVVLVVSIVLIASCPGNKPDSSSSSSTTPSVDSSSSKPGPDSSSSSPVEPAHVHTYGEWVVDEEPTCTSMGERHRTCTDPECPDKGTDAATEVESIPVAHKFGTNGVCTECGYDPSKTYTYNTYTAVSPSNWNALTYQDNNDTQIMNYLGGSFFNAGYKLKDASKGVTADNIVSGEFTVEYSFVTKIEDVTSEYVGQYGVTEDSENLVWKLTIRSDGKWDDGTPIVAGDFVYSMKEQLNPLFKNYRADSFYAGSVNLYKAWDYVFQGSDGWFSAVTALGGVYDAASDAKMIFCLGTYEGVDNYFRQNMGFPASYDAAKTAQYLKNNYIADLDLEVVASMEGKSLADIKADAAMKAEWDKIIGWWQTEPNEELHFFAVKAKLPAVDFSEVGIFAPDDTTIVIAMKNAIEFVDAEGNLTYHCFYELSDLPLVHKAKYEANKVAPAAGGTLWTSTYNSSVASTASWGPYKLTVFQAGKYYVLERNENFYGFTSGLYLNQYQTDRIECETISDYQTALLKFQKGELDDIGIDSSVANDYKGSSQAIFTPDDFVGSLQLQSSKEALKQRETDGVNKSILSYHDFRKAISLAFDRATYTRTCTTSSLAGFGLFNSMHYYDVAHGGVYRNTDIAKQVLCEVYGIDMEEYVDLDEAYNAITGYDPAQAKTLVNSAYEAALAAGDIKATDKVVLTYGSSADTVGVRRNYEFIKNALIEMCKGTKLEGRIDVKFDASFGSKWADDFRDGAYDICQGGWSGAAWNPGYFLMAYLSPDYMYSTAWDTSSEMVTITVHGVKEVDNKFVVTNKAEDSITKTLAAYGDKASSGQNTNWYQLLNVEWAQGKLADNFRLEVIGALEKTILTQYYSVPISYSFTASMISKQVEYVSRNYNTFMAYGGLRYMTYKYNDGAWTEYVKSQGGTIDYKG